jgi:hypothetical protein
MAEGISDVVVVVISLIIFIEIKGINNEKSKLINK